MFSNGFLACLALEDVSLCELIGGVVTKIPQKSYELRILTSHHSQSLHQSTLLCFLGQ